MKEPVTDQESSAVRPLDALSCYRADLAEVSDLLAPQQVTHLSERIRSARADTSGEHNPAAQQDAHRLAEANLRLVLLIARRYAGYGVDLLDLVQEGNLGLLHAIDKFDERLGYLFSTYAIHWIRQYVLRALATHSRLIRLPIYKVDQLKRLARLSRHLQTQAQEPTPQALSVAMALSIAQIEELLSCTQQPLSLEARLLCDEEVPLVETIEDQTVDAPEHWLVAQHLAEQVRALLGALGERERTVLTLRFGLDGEHEHSLSQTGRRLGISRETVRQIETRALRQLLPLAHERHLEEFLQ